MDHFPSEVLSAFFALVKRFASSNRCRSGAARVNAEVKVLIGLSGVCRHWRQAVLNDGTLWTDVPVDTARAGCGQLLRIILERSKQSTISVTASVLFSTADQETIEDVLKIIAENFNRIGDLTLDTDSSSFPEGWTSPAPMLRKLRINNRGPCAPLTAMFGGQTPRLESLTLSGFVACPAGFLHSLKHLALKLPLTHTPVLATAVVDLLAAAPSIETLSFTSFLSITNNCPHSLKAAPPRLRNVLFRRCDTVSILPHLVIPKEAELHILVDHRTFRLGINLQSTDHHILAALPPFPETYLFLSTSPKLVIEVGETLNWFAIALIDAISANLRLKISECSGRIPADFVRRSLETIPSHPYLKTAGNITMSIPPTAAGVPWASWFKGFAFATQLSVRALPAEVVLRALMRTDEDGLPICPRLKRVGFYGTRFSAIPADWRLVAKLFLFRAAIGFPLQKVAVTERGAVKDFGPPAWLGALVDSEADQLHEVSYPPSFRVPIPTLCLLQVPPVTELAPYGRSRLLSKGLDPSTLEGCTLL